MKSKRKSGYIQRTLHAYWSCKVQQTSEDFQMNHSTSNYWLSAQNWLFFFLVYHSLETWKEICQTLRRLKLPTSSEILFAWQLPFVYTSTTSRWVLLTIELACCYWMVGRINKALTLQRCAGLGISVSHSSAIRMQTKAAAPNVSKATSWKEDIVSKTLQLNFLKEVVTKKKTAQINMSQNEVSSYECFADSVHASSCKLLENAG